MFQREPRTYTLTFEGQEGYDGLEVVMRGLSIGAFMEVSRLSVSATGTEGVDALLKAFCGSIVSWNLADELGQPVGIDLDGVTGCDTDFVMKIISAWMQAIAGVNAELGKGSHSGAITDTSKELSLEMERL